MQMVELEDDVQKNMKRASGGKGLTARVIKNEGDSGSAVTTIRALVKLLEGKHAQRPL